MRHYILLGITTLLISCNGKNTNSSNKEIDRLKDENPTIKEAKGYWHPIQYTEENGSGLTQAEIDLAMKQRIYVSSDTLVFFGDTLYPTVINTIKINTQDYLRDITDSSKRYEMITPKITLVSIDGEMKNQKDNKIFTTTHSFAYDGKYIIVSKDVVNFLFVRD